MAPRFFKDSAQLVNRNKELGSITVVDPSMACVQG